MKSAVVNRWATTVQGDYIYGEYANSTYEICAMRYHDIESRRVSIVQLIEISSTSMLRENGSNSKFRLIEKVSIKCTVGYFS